jgi:hypothetical protein
LNLLNIPGDELFLTVIFFFPAPFLPTVREGFAVLDAAFSLGFVAVICFLLSIAMH